MTQASVSGKSPVIFSKQREAHVSSYDYLFKFLQLVSKIITWMLLLNVNGDSPEMAQCSCLLILNNDIHWLRPCLRTLWNGKCVSYVCMCVFECNTDSQDNMFQNFLPAVVFEMQEASAAVSPGWEGSPWWWRWGVRWAQALESDWLGLYSHPDLWQVFKLYRFVKWVWYYPPISQNYVRQHMGSAVHSAWHIALT